ncbi:LacI family DNA-binding transcriptional regulator [Alkalicoccus daliensis]|uniref:Transcriptional regulator, LacI family n=1 Tax=Alkalicoccus daliensis TaxID=745820 RepID=A0A1H0KBC4_9BACI|nr:LacI family DNA-binding transcriptional regulator [Alkalicoccus daliensis]SDO53159.1 transcriptional regulator, LacI family [Alkalicoccus daliensis]
MRVTIKEIAKLAGLSTSSVSKIINNYDDINEETKQKVWKIIEEHNYRPSYSAKSLASNSTNVIGVIYAGKVNVGFSHPFFVDVLDAFKREIGSLGYDLLFFSNEKFHQHKEDYLERCLHYNVDGCVIISGEEVEPSIAKIDKSSIPSIGIDLKMSGPKSSYIMTDNREISSLALRHFYEFGYKNVAFFGGSETSFISKERRYGFEQAVQQFSLHSKQEWQFIGDFFEESGYYLMKQLLSMDHKPNAVFASSDLMALGALRAIKESVFPVSDFSVIGVDDLAAGSLVQPSLTTIRQNKKMIGTMAATMLNELISGHPAPAPLLLEPKLIVRESSTHNTPPNILTTQEVST